MKIDKKSLKKRVSVDKLPKQKGFETFLSKLRSGDEVWEWKTDSLFRFGAAGGFVIVRDGEPTDDVFQTYTG